jgi:hypothetical protein
MGGDKADLKFGHRSTPPIGALSQEGGFMDVMFYQLAIGAVFGFRGEFVPEDCDKYGTGDRSSGWTQLGSHNDGNRVGEFGWAVFVAGGGSGVEAGLGALGAGRGRAGPGGAGVGGSVKKCGVKSAEFKVLSPESTVRSVSWELRFGERV